jgi:hypothetical protein
MTIHQREFLPSAGNYDELRQLLIARRKSLGLSQLETDEISGLPSGYVAKLECCTKRMGPLSLMCLLGALKVRLALIPDAASYPDLTVSSEGLVRVVKNHHSTIGKKGGKARMARMTARQRREFARKAVEIRWSKVREAERAEKAERERAREVSRQARRFRGSGALLASRQRATTPPMNSPSEGRAHD